MSSSHMLQSSPLSSPVANDVAINTSMSAPKDENLIKAASQGAKQFVDTYYDALNKDRSSLADFYTTDANIGWNGNALVGGEQFATFFAPMPQSFYDVQSYDAHPMGPNEDGTTNVLLLVSGAVKYGEPSAKPRGFSDTFVLKPGEKNKFRISSQGFRLVSS